LAVIIFPSNATFPSAPHTRIFLPVTASRLNLELRIIARSGFPPQRVYHHRLQFCNSEFEFFPGGALHLQIVGALVSETANASVSKPTRGSFRWIKNVFGL